MQPAYQGHMQPLLRYGFSVICVATALGLALILHYYRFRDLELPILSLAVAVATWYGGLGPSVLAVLLSMAAFNYFFTEPYFSFYVSRTDIPYFLTFVLWAIIVAWFSIDSRWTHEGLRQARDRLQIEVEQRALREDDISRLNQELAKRAAELEATNKNLESFAYSLEADLARINRVSIMGELAASLAHEIKQPIAGAAASAHACLRWLQLKPPKTEDARGSVSRILNDLDRASDIIDRNVSLYARGATQRELIDLNEIIRLTVVLLQNSAKRYSISVRTELALGLPTTTADRVQLQQVLTNLMFNGIEAMQDTGGELTVASRRSEDGQLLISVSDSGKGLSIDDAERFEAFYTTKPQGNGIGLSISRRIIESHGGRLWAGPNTGRGATFQFVLPLT